jgi:hypothetical protein
MMLMENNNPFLTNRNINKIENYIPFYHTKAYLKQKAGSLKYFKNQIPQIKKIAEKVGYKDFNQFIKHRKLWHNFEKKIPLSYLKAIGVKLDILKFTIELDQKAYQKALKIPRYPKSYIIQTRPFPLTKRLPKDISEEKAVELVKREAAAQNKSCVIYYPSLKKIFINIDGSVLTAYYQPDIKIEGDYIIPDKINDFTGKISL